MFSLFANFSTFYHLISPDYSAEGTYTCTAKNRASGNNEVTNSTTSASVVVLKTVTVTFAAEWVDPISHVL